MAEDRAESRTSDKAKSRTAGRATSRTADRAKDKTEARAEGRAEGRTAGRAKDKTEARAEGMTEAKAEGWTEARAESRTSDRAKSRTEAEIEGKPEARAAGRAESRTDRRVRRTKALLLQGLMQLMETKDIKDISVKELSDLADINRGTFYLHYNDVYDMLAQIEDELFVEFHDIIDRTLDPDSHSPRTTLFEVFSFLERHMEVVRVMMGPHGDLSFVNRLKDLVKTRLDGILAARRAAEYGCYLESFTVSGCIGVIETWLAQPAPPSPAVMADICGTILERGFQAS